MGICSNIVDRSANMRPETKKYATDGKYYSLNSFILALLYIQ